jgi:Na+:H+ antiporter, NhaA family
MKTKASKLFNEFFESEKAGGIILIFATLFSLLLANSRFQLDYLSFLETKFQNHSITHWINDGLMTFFFLLIGLELEREIYHGELSTLKKASLPVFAAIGGMIFPALFFLFLILEKVHKQAQEYPWQPILHLP